MARKKAGKVQEKKPRKNLFPSDEESIGYALHVGAVPQKRKPANKKH